MSGSAFHVNVARFLQTTGSGIVGTGVIVHSGWVLTCAHVAAAAATGSKKFDRKPPHGSVRLDISDHGRRRELTATFRSCVWGPADEDHWRSAGDYTFLKLLDKEVPAGLDLARTSVRQLHGIPLYAYGFPEHYDEDGRSASLRVANNPYGEADGLVRVHRDNVKDEFIEPGLSGAPVLPLNADYSVIGIVKADNVSPDRSIEEAYIIPGEILYRGFTKVAILHHTEWLKEEERQHQPKASVYSRARIGSPLGELDIAVTRVVARSWRYVPAYFFTSERPNLHGGRFNRASVPALYYSLSVGAALRELSAHSQRGRPTPGNYALLAQEVSSDRVFDARDPGERARLYLGLGIDPLLQQNEDKVVTPMKHFIADCLIAAGFTGMIYPSRLQGTVGDEAALVLWDVGLRSSTVKNIEVRQIDKL